MPTPRLVLIVASSLIVAACGDDKNVTATSLGLSMTVPFGEEGNNDDDDDSDSGGVTGGPTTGGTDTSAGPSTSDPSSDPSTTNPSSDPSTTNPTTDPSTTDPSSDPDTTDPSSDPDTTDPTNDPDTTDPTNDPDTTDPTNETSDDTTGGGDSVAECKALFGGGSCNTCICEYCTYSYEKCMDDPGCNAVTTCFETSGCTNDCYTVCEDVVNMHGGPDGPWRGPYEDILICRIQLCQLYC